MLQNKIGKKVLGSLLVLVSILFFTTGCKSSKEADKKSNSDKKTITVMMWGEKARWDAQEKLNQEFQKKYPDLEIKFIKVANQDDYWSKLQTMVAGGDAPDVAMQQEMLTPTYVAKGFMTDLTDYMANDPDFDKESLSESSYDQFIVNDKVYAIPTMTFTNVLFYNKDLFDEAGLDYPDEDTDWAQLRELAKKLTKDTNNDGVVDQFGFTFGAWPPFMYSPIWANGGDIIEEGGTKGVLNSEANIETYTFFHDLIWKDGSAPSAQINKDNMFSFESGKVAMTDMGSWLIATNDLNKINYGITLPAKAPTGERAVCSYPNGWFIVNQSKQKDDAWKYLSFCASEKGQKIAAEAKVGIPTNLEVANTNAYLDSSTTEGLDLSITLKALEIARPAYASTNMNELNVNVYPELDNIWTNKEANIKKVLDETQKKLQDELDKAPKID